MMFIQLIKPLQKSVVANVSNFYNIIHRINFFKMKQIFIIIFFVCVSGIILAQKLNELPVQKYMEHKTFNQITKKYTNNVPRFSVLMGYYRNNFLNPDFEINLDTAYNYLYGLNLNTRLEYFPLIFDLGWFYSFYEDFSSDFSGLEGSVSYAFTFLPENSYITWVPYFGGGYQHTFSNRKWSVSNPIVKGGLMINIGEASEFILNGEFKQSLPLSRENTYNQFSINMGFRGKTLATVGKVTGTVALLLALGYLLQ